MDRGQKALVVLQAISLICTIVVTMLAIDTWRRYRAVEKKVAGAGDALKAKVEGLLDG